LAKNPHRRLRPPSGHRCGVWRISYPQLGHPIGRPFGLVCTSHHLTTPSARITPHAATAPIASSDNTNQISSGQVSIPNPQLDLGNYIRPHCRLHAFSFHWNDYRNLELNSPSTTNRTSSQIKK